MAMTASEIQTAIDKLEAAKIDLAMGKKTVSVGYDGKTVTYKSTDLQTINGVIMELRSQLYKLAAGPRPRRGFQIQF